ncbi:MAG TPA: methyltransferase domain-containing protein [Acidimicrobiia bacterium]|nr:methyltransferase domain-containing protein [Acidimicrobiia bacterium]
MKTEPEPTEEQAPSARPRTIVRVARVVLAIAGLAFLVGALVDTWGRSEKLLRSPVRLGLAFVVYLVSLMLWSRAWSALLEHQADRRALRHGFYFSQLGKYVPGGIWQAAGLVTLGRDAGAGLGDASTAFFVLAVTQVAGASTVGAIAAVAAPDLPVVFRVLVIASVLLVPLVYRGWMVAALRLVGRKISRLDVAFVPTQRAILRSYAWAVVATAAASVSFAIIARPHHAGVFIAAIAAFATAWWIGFVAIPFPSGIGIREAVLLAALRAPLTSGVVLGAAIGQRLVSIVAEATLIGGSGTHRLRRRRAAGTVRAMSADPAADSPRRPLGLAPGAPEQAAGQDAKKYSTGNPVVQKLIGRWATRLRAEIATLAPPGEVLADIGVGEGLALERIRPDGTVVVGVEYRSDKIRCARDLLDGLHGVVADAGMLPLRDAAVPLTTCIEVLEHLTDPEPAVRELARVAGRGCVVSVPWEPWFRLGNFARGKNVGRLGNDPEHLQFFTRRRLEKLLGRHFESVRVLPVFPWLVGVATDPRRSG